MLKELVLFCSWHCTGKEEPRSCTGHPSVRLLKKVAHSRKSSSNTFPLSSLKAMAPHSSALAWKIPWTEEPGRLQSMGLLRVGHNKRLHFHFSLSCIGEGNGSPLQCSCLENPRDGAAWWAAVHGVAKSQTRLNAFTFTFYYNYSNFRKFVNDNTISSLIPTQCSGRG